MGYSASGVSSEIGQLGLACQRVSESWSKSARAGGGALTDSRGILEPGDFAAEGGRSESLEGFRSSKEVVFKSVLRFARRRALEWCGWRSSLAEMIEDGWREAGPLSEESTKLLIDLREANLLDQLVDEGDAFRPCNIFVGKTVNVNGWCSVWVPKV